MKKVFADTSYWIAITNPKDELHSLVQIINKSIKDSSILTTDEVLVEFLAYFSSKYSGTMRKAASEITRRILNNTNIQVIPQSRDSFLSGLKLYEERLDKEYSLVDCISMVTMKNEDITEILTSDFHFTQEGFSIYLSKSVSKKN